MASGATVVLAFASIFTAIGLVFVALSFATDHWVEYTVDREALIEELPTEDLDEPYFYSRDRGLFRTCYDGKEATFLDDAEDVVDGSCILEDGYQLESDADKANWGDDYELRIHLMRSHFGLFCFAMLMLVIGCIVGAIGCWKLSGRMLRIAGLVVFFGAFLTAGGMACFHGYEYLERQKIIQPYPEFPAYWNERTETEFVVLQDHSDMRYGYSYFFGWMGMGTGAIAAILYLCAAYSLTEDTRPRYEDKTFKAASRGFDDPAPYSAKPPSLVGPTPAVYAEDMINPGYAPSGAVMAPKASMASGYPSLPAVGYPGY